MTHLNRNLGALIGSRICHDLISPVGAISNGLELLGLAGVPDGPELALVADSAANANARLRFFRVAFGLSSEAQSMTAREIRAILGDVYTAKMHCDWQVEGPLPRRMAQAAFLAILCAEQAAPFGGTVTITGSEARLRVAATGGRLAPQEAHWAWLTGDAPGDVDTLPAAQVQFALLPDLLSQMGRRAELSLGADEAALEF
ncbi:histidine phosphotransferase [Pelagivirga sediminicola]|uniref:Histidine phosphotransferase n=1 Tax=Pelagivirga sediminicola TaxID=2170575 RepID=A0A2T7G333_9RHOB|nr:histidine phosphotransferase family protein [Pelagivirga sediminicola]PVA08829.1 histidine phosphotransferase [Pelagivirga sediminicola]